MSKNNTGNEKEAEEGEVMRFMKDIEKESKSMMLDLTDMDDMLLSLQERVEAGKSDQKEILRTIENVRLRIGVMEREDKRELNEEEVAESLLSKLKKWVDQLV
jgi:hypothetical protein